MTLRGNHRAKIGEIHIDQAGLGKETPDAAQTVGHEAVANLKCLHHAGFLIQHLERVSGWAGKNDSIGRRFQLLQAGFCLTLTASSALEVEWQRRHCQDECAAFAGHARQNRSGPGSGATTQAGEDENDVRPRAE